MGLFIFIIPLILLTNNFVKNLVSVLYIYIIILKKKFNPLFLFVNMTNSLE